MVNGGFKRVNVPRKKGDIIKGEEDWRFVYSNKDLQRLSGTDDLRIFIQKQQLKYLGHICRLENSDSRKHVLFATNQNKYSRDLWITWEKVLSMDQNLNQRYLKTLLSISANSFTKKLKKSIKKKEFLIEYFNNLIF